jgi:hypothetical protein
MKFTTELHIEAKWSEDVLRKIQLRIFAGTNSDSLKAAFAQRIFGYNS